MAPESRSLTRSVGIRLLGPLLHRDSPRPPRGPGRLTVRLNQSLFERSLAPPWVFSRAQCQAYWASPPDAGNQPLAYARKSTAVVDFLHRFWGPEVTAESSILEIGCNAGANLQGLHQLGYADLAGVEINATAVEEMGRQFPAMAQAATIHVGAFEEVLPGLPDRSADAVFAMAVLMHVHPKSREVFEHMARIARRYVCVVESENATTPHVFARDYGRVFSRAGCRETRSEVITPEDHPELMPDYEGFVARLFEKG